MRFQMRFIAAACALVLAGSAASADELTFNALCLHNGGEYYVHGIDHSLPENGGGKFFPSFTHWAGQGVGDPVHWPWKMRGWSWVGMQGAKAGPDWTWETCLMQTKDRPYASTMTWPYPLNYALGVLSPQDEPSPLYSGTIPSTAPSPVAGNGFIYPSSFGGFDQDLNVVAASGDWTLPSTAAFYGYEFGFLMASPSSAPSSLGYVEIPSGCSVYEYVWENKGAVAQYLVQSGDEMDCTGTAGGNKGKSYSVGGLNGTEAYYFPNTGQGSTSEWAMCLLLKDAVTIPVNPNASGNQANPFASRGFDVGSATVTPLASSNQAVLQLMTSDFENPDDTGRFLLAGSPWNGPAIPYGKAGNRLPHAFDFFTYFFLGSAPYWFHTISKGYPAAAFGETAGGNSPAIPIPGDPILYSIELRICAFSTQGRAPSASFMITLF